MNIAQFFWPKALLSALPELLSTLVSPKNCQSLERLQLLSLEIKMINRDLRGSPRFIEQHIEEIDQKLNLTGLLTVDEQPLAQVKVSFYMRGQRKFFKVAAKGFLPESSQAIAPIALADIALFFKDLGQENNFFYDQALSELNGIMKPNVPSQMVIALLLEQVFVLIKNQEVLTIDFIQAVKIDQALSIARSEDQGLWAILADGEIAAELTRSN